MKSFIILVQFFCWAVVAYIQAQIRSNFVDCMILTPNLYVDCESMSFSMIPVIVQLLHVCDEHFEINVQIGIGHGNPTVL